MRLDASIVKHRSQAAVRCTRHEGGTRHPAGRRGVAPLLVGMILFFSGLAVAQRPDADQQSSSQGSPQGVPQSSPTVKSPSKEIRLGGVTLSGSLRGRAENWGWFEAPPGESKYTFGAFQLRISLGQKTERIDWQVEGVFPALIHLPTNAILSAPQGQLGLGASYFAANGKQDASAVIRQGYVRFKSLFGDTASSLRLGRFEFSEGAETIPGDATLAVLKRDRIAQRLIGPFGFSHIGRGFDGVQYVRNTKLNNLTLVAVRPTEGVFQLRSLFELDIDLYYGSFTRQLGRKSSKGEARAFAIYYHDGRNVLKADNRPQAARAADHGNIRLTTIGGHYLGVFGKGEGKTDLLLWGAAQFGRWGTLDHRAGALAIEGGYQFAARWKPWLRAGYSRSTGDGNPNDAVHSTFFQVLPTPRIYARFPFFNLMNNQDVFGQFLLKPLSKLTLRTDVHYLRLSNTKDLWYLGGGAFQKGTFGYTGRPSGGNAGLGTLFDLSADYNVTSTTTVTLYLGGVRGGGVQAAIYPAGGPHPTAHLIYFEFIQRF